MNKICPVCNSKDTEPDIECPNTMTNCNQCGSDWNIDNDILLDTRGYYTEEENKQLGRNPLRRK